MISSPQQTDTLEEMFVFRRIDGTLTLLFDPANNGLPQRGYFSGDLSPDQIKTVRTFLSDRLDRQLGKSWAERRFIPKFLIAAIVFIVVYFFLSFVIRDPLPIVDELIGGIIASVAVFGFLSRRDASSLVYKEEKSALIRNLDLINFSHLDLMEHLESCFESFLGRDETSIEEVSVAINASVPHDQVAIMAKICHYAALLQNPSMQKNLRRADAGKHRFKTLLGWAYYFKADALSNLLALQEPYWSKFPN